jgi:hypothetical protein
LIGTGTFEFVRNCVWLLSWWWWFRVWECAGESFRLREGLSEVKDDVWECECECECEPAFSPW